LFTFLRWRAVLKGHDHNGKELWVVDETEGSKETAGTRLTRYLTQKSLKPFIYKDKPLDHFKPLICYKGDSKINGYEATVLVDICDGILQARKEIALFCRMAQE
jgi:hypothetical protein